MTGSQPIFPPVYPHSYYFSRHYRGAHETAFSYLPLNDSNAKIYSRSSMLANRLLVDFEKVTFDRSGIMLGEYVALGDGLFLIDARGNCISINFPPDASATARIPYETTNTYDFWTLRQWVLDNWNTLPLIEDGTIWSHIYHNNYYHFTYEYLQKARMIEGGAIRNILMNPALVRMNFQKDLLARTLGDKNIILSGQPVRMINPTIVDAWQSYEAIGWLRRTMKFHSYPGNNRYYIRRNPTKKRAGNNISENHEFLAFLEKHSFRVIDFGNGEFTVQAQVAMMNEAAIILAPHGAGLTNISYLNPPLAVIECFSRRVLSASFMQIAICLGFKYYGVISEDEDGDECMVPDIKVLEEIMDDVARSH